MGAALAGGRAEVLPAVPCAGFFDSAPLDPAMDGSSLVAVWFQDGRGSRRARTPTPAARHRLGGVGRDYEF
ncbi:hypothetical protein [Streptomyces sp. NPDC047974]|uniref:hypothetical protein n=1 Tax=Streptomyces sp. NPDC047974 TaxID=3154343 RepID=UPI0033D0511F